jgi:hypothetical protein
MGRRTLRDQRPDALDAIHLASALAAAPAGAAAVLCGYDRRLQDAGREHGLLTISPG